MIFKEFHRFNRCANIELFHRFYLCLALIFLDRKLTTIICKDLKILIFKDFKKFHRFHRFGNISNHFTDFDFHRYDLKESSLL